jgi:microcystin-dependent protein
MPVGATIWYPSVASIPAGWLVCDGSYVGQATYPDLYALIGATFGAVQGSTFKLPNVTDKFILGRDVAAANIGAVDGAATVTLTAAQMPTHNHAHAHRVTDHSHTFPARQNSTAGAGNRAMAASATGTAVNLDTTEKIDLDTDTSTVNAGGGASHTNMPPYIRMQAIIRATPETSVSVEFDVLDCDLRWRKDGGAWSTLVDLSDCSTPGAQGIQGVQGATGAQGTQGAVGDTGDCVCVEAPAPIASDTETNCGIALEISERMSQHLTDVLEGIDAGLTLAQFLGSLLSISIVGVVVDSVVETVTDATNTGTAIIRSDVTEAWIEEQECLLFEALNVSGYSFSALSTWKDEGQLAAVLALNVGGGVWYSTINDFTDEFWAQRAYVGSLAPTTACVAMGCPQPLPDCAAGTQPQWRAFDGGNVTATITPSGTNSAIDGTTYRTVASGGAMTFVFADEIVSSEITLSYATSRPPTEAAPTVTINGVTYPITTSSGTNPQLSNGLWQWTRYIAIGTRVAFTELTINLQTSRTWYVSHLEFDCD